MTPRRSLLALALALPWWRGAGAQIPKAAVLSTATPQVRLQAAERRMARVQALHNQWANLREEAAQGSYATTNAQDEWAHLLSRRDNALESSARTRTALTDLQASIASAAQALQAAQTALPPWHAAVATLAQANPSQLPAATQAADTALARRREADATLRAACADTRRTDRLWDNTRKSALRELEGAQAALAGFKHAARNLTQRGDELRTSLAAAVAQHQRLLAEKQLNVPATALTLPAPASAAALRPLLADGPANPTIAQPVLGQFANLASQREQLAAQWAQVRDAHAYHRLAAKRMANSAAELQRLDARVPQIDTDLQATDLQFAQALDSGRAWCAAGPVASAALLRDAMAQLQTPAASCLQDAARDFAQVVQAADRLLPQLDKAQASAVRDWEAAYQAVHGRPPDAPAMVGAPAGAMPAMPPPVSAAMARPEIVGHAYREFDILDHEDEDYAAYTYVLLRSANDLAKPDVNKRWLHLLKVVRERTTDADKITTKAQRERLHLFCLPLRKDVASAASTSAYHGDLGDQLKINAQTGLLMNDALSRRLTDSPGPFLLTLPQRIAASNSRTPLLFADLARYDENAVADLVINYMDGLLVDFPRDQALWKPPVVQRVALAIFQCAANTGSLIQALLPGSSAPPTIKT